MPKVDTTLAQLSGAQAVQQAGCKQRILTNPIIRGINTVNYIYSPLWKILLQQAVI